MILPIKVLNEIRIRLELVVAERKVPVLVIPTFTFSLALHVVVDIVFGGPFLVSEESVTMSACICKYLIGNSPADDIKPSFTFGEKFCTTLIHDDLHCKCRGISKTGSYAHIVEGAKS